ncbi:type II toxin-antitoxin system VapC family toxin [Brevundimonas diminuta]|uniref:type II toxin-antitoxin system VapC family toxin n=1 Tax=Brevundimonas diminuta TaxID=293 RepID=UPI0030F4E76D
MTTLFDTNALIAALNDNDPHNGWALDQLLERKALGPIAISDVVYSELSIGMADRAQADSVIAALGIERLPNHDDALYEAGQAFKLYKNRQGTKTNVLPDFFIGAAASIEGAPLVTANAKDFVGYFPNISIISP